MGIGLDDYKFGRKNNWRRQIWNEAIVRLKKSGKQVSSCIVLYLPGVDDIDGKIAIEKGFKPWNLYAVENNPERVKLLRNKKVNVIEADFNLVLLSWNLSQKIDFVFADFCGGITTPAASLMLSLATTTGLSEKAVVAINLLRGRDKWIRESYKRYLSDVDKHRGKQWYRIFLFVMIEMAIEGNRLLNIDGTPDKLIALYNKLTIDFTIPREYSYKSIRPNSVTLIMDSVVFNWGTLVNQAPTDNKIYHTVKLEAGNRIEKVKGLGGTFDYSYDFSHIRNKIQASKAIHTMRKNGQLGGFVQ